MHFPGKTFMKMCRNYKVCAPINSEYNNPERWENKSVFSAVEAAETEEEEEDDDE